MLTKIYGKPPYKTQVKKQVTSNAFAVTSDLEGGSNGHLGLVCILIEYANVNLVVYVQPVHPGLLDIEEDANQYNATRICEEHKGEVRFVLESIDIQKVITKWIFSPCGHVRRADVYAVRTHKHILPGSPLFIQYCLT